jgi:hypothetical protein
MERATISESLVPTEDELVTVKGVEPLEPLALRAATCPRKFEGKPKVTALIAEVLLVV